MISLSDVCLDKDVRVVNLNVDKNILRRFLDIGLIEGTVIRKVLKSYSGGINAYLIMDSIFAIRDKDIKGVMVEYV